MSGADTAPVERARRAADGAEPEFGRFLLARFLDLGVEYDERQTCMVALPYAPHLCNPQGSVHGGVITTAMDIAMGHVCHRYLRTAVTIEMQIRFLRPLRVRGRGECLSHPDSSGGRRRASDRPVTGDGRCVGRLVEPGGRIVHLESRMYDDENRLTAHATGCWHRLDALGSGR